MPFAACAWLLLTPGIVGATQPAQAAEAHNERGIDLFKSKQFTAALSAFESAYQLDPSPTFLCNIGRAQARLNRYGLAVSTLQACLQADASLTPKTRQTISGELAEAQRSLELERLADGPEPAPAPLLSLPEPAVVYEQQPRPTWRLALGGGLVGVGVGLLGIGGYALSLHGQCTEPTSPCQTVYQTLPGGALAVVAGSAAVVSGVVLLVLPGPRRMSTRP